MMDRAGPRVAWITGASTGIGLAVARTIADAGFLVVLSARNEDQLREACLAIEAGGGNAVSLVADVCDRIAMNAARDEILRAHGRIDLLVNNAGFNSQKRKWDELIAEEFDAVIAANLTGTFNAIHAVLPTMREQKDGLIVNISSLAGKQINPDGGVAYTVAKHGVHIMSRMLNQTELQHGVRACVIAPGGVKTRAHDWRPDEIRKFMLEPEDVARAVRFAVEQPPHSAVAEIEINWSPV